MLINLMKILKKFCTIFANVFQSNVVLQYFIHGGTCGVVCKATLCDADMKVLIYVPAIVIAIQLPANGLRSAAEDGTGPWAPATHNRSLDEVSGS